MKGEQLITRLPDYFPTTLKPCKAQTEAFFTCFEEAAVMKHERDVESAPQALIICQESLKAYKKCMDANINRENKEWWKVW